MRLPATLSFLYRDSGRCPEKKRKLGSPSLHHMAVGLHSQLPPMAAAFNGGGPPHAGLLAPEVSAFDDSTLRVARRAIPGGLGIQVAVPL